MRHAELSTSGSIISTTHLHYEAGTEGLEVAWERGYLKDSHDPSDYRLSGMNTGWEVTGPIDVEMQVRGLRLEARMKATKKP